MTEKTLDNTNAEEAKKKVSDIKIVGDGDSFKVLSTASSNEQGWMKSTKAMPTGNGVIVQVTTQQRNPDGSWAVAEALTFVPDVKIEDDVNLGHKLIPTKNILLG